MFKRWYATDEGPLFFDCIALENVHCFRYKGIRYLATSRWSLFWIKSTFQDERRPS